MEPNSKRSTLEGLMFKKLTLEERDYVEAPFFKIN